jgi:predicted RNA methylase
MISATYSPEDDKIRLYASSRLNKETYDRVKGAGFRWAPKQDLFYAVWSPKAEDLATELAGEIEDEDKSLVDRAEERAERFEGYQEKRAADAERARDAVAAIADNIPFGQPILVGHHSERAARRDAEKIESGMRKAIKLWETSEYWQSRAAGALAHAKYKELPAVRARRIKTLEAEKRKFERSRTEAAKFLAAWSKQGLTLEEGIKIANYCHLHLARKEGDRPDYDGKPSAYDALTNGYPSLYAPRTLEEVVEAAKRVYPRTIAYCDRWINHLANRITYERAMLDEQGASKLLDPKPRRTLPPLINYRGENGQIIVENRYHRGQFDTLRQVDMTSAEYAKIYTDYKGTSIVEGSHRIRIAIVKHERVAVFLTDSKTHEKPPAAEPKKPEPRPVRIPTAEPRSVPKPERNDFDAMRESLKQGIQTATAPELFPTPRQLAERVAELADIQPGHTVLEPSAGTGNLIEAAQARGGDVTAIEINAGLARALASKSEKTRCADFLECGPELGKFDRIIMNPPFSGQADIAHVNHALKFLKPGGNLVAIMAAGVTFRQDRKASEFRSMIEKEGGTIETLPDDTFKEAGTSVRTVLVCYTAPGQPKPDIENRTAEQPTRPKPAIYTKQPDLFG